MGRAYAEAYEPVAPVGSRYTPPHDVTVTTLREALQGAPRGILDQKQMSFIANLAGSGLSGDLQLFAAGSLSLLQRPCVAIIGTRQVTPEGAARARKLARAMAHENIVVVSGLAEGVDTEAMTAAIQYGGSVIGVIGTPLDKAYPAKNKRLQEKVYRQHLLISQFRPGSTVTRASFPQRNRLMAALTDGTVVIEASDTSGTLHQAVECTRLGRWLFIAKSVVENPTLSWPKRFLDYEKCVVLEQADDVVRRVAAEWRS